MNLSAAPQGDMIFRSVDEIFHQGRLFEVVFTNAMRSFSSDAVTTAFGNSEAAMLYAGFTIAGNRLQALIFLLLTIMPAGVGIPLLLSRFLVAALSQLKARTSGQAPV